MRITGLKRRQLRGHILSVTMGVGRPTKSLHRMTQSSTTFHHSIMGLRVNDQKGAMNRIKQTIYVHLYVIKFQQIASRLAKNWKKPSEKKGRQVESGRYSPNNPVIQRNQYTIHLRSKIHLI